LTNSQVQTRLELQNAGQLEMQLLLLWTAGSGDETPKKCTPVRQSVADFLLDGFVGVPGDYKELYLWA
jgi:hypothetical protein